MKKTYKNKDSKKVQTRKNSVFTNIDYHSGDGMLTSVWGPSLWHFLHTMSFNYPVHPSDKDKEHYLNFMRSLQYVLPCKYCRTNLKRNYKELPISKGTMKDRDTFSKYVYDLHEHINKMLHKKIQSQLRRCKRKIRTFSFSLFDRCSNFFRNKK